MDITLAQIQKLLPLLNAKYAEQFITSVDKFGTPIYEDLYHDISTAVLKFSFLKHFDVTDDILDFCFYSTPKRTIPDEELDPELDFLKYKLTLLHRYQKTPPF